MKRRGVENKKTGAKVVLAGFVLLSFFVCRQVPVLQNGAGDYLKKRDGREAAQNERQIQLADIAAQCMVWESRYGTENALPVELFADLQRYVAEGKCAAVLPGYRQDELICTVEELAKSCPDYKTLVGKYFADQYGENFLQTDKIYRLEKADGEGCFLLFYLHYTGTDDSGCLSTMTLKKDGEEWQLTGNAGRVSGVLDYEIFAREEEGEKVFYFLQINDSLTWLTLSRLSENFYVPLGGWDIGLIETEVKPEILFQATESALGVQIKEYIEENACFLAWMQQNHKQIWGDEGKEEHYVMREADGREQIWVIDFEEANRKETVTFQMTEAEDGSLFLEALAGGGNGNALLSCKLIFIQEAGVRKITPTYWEAFDCNGLTVRTTENLAWNEMWESVLQEQQQRSIASWQGEKEFPNAVFNLMREEAWTGLYREPNMLLDKYGVDLTENTERFMHMILQTGKESIYGYDRETDECKWAYRWLGEDESENFLSCINYCYAKDSIQWWKVTEGRLEEYAYVTEYENPSQIISCEGQVYCITEAVPNYRGGEVYTSIVEIGNGENWRTSCFFISTGIDPAAERNIACIALYEAEGLSSGIKDYVQGRYEEIVRACENRKLILSETEEGQGQIGRAHV